MSTRLRDEAERGGIADDLSSEYARTSFATYLSEYCTERVEQDARLFGERFDEALRHLLDDRRRIGRQAGEVKAYRRILRALVKNTDMSLPEAMEAVGIPKEEQGKYLHLRYE